MRIVGLGPGEVDRVGPLWKQMVEHHRAVADAEWPVRGADDSWERRRRDYLGWLESGKGWLFGAVREDDEDGPLLGYAVLTVERPGPTWDLGERIGELESLVVDDDARGEGIGTALIDHCRELLRAEGIHSWGVAVVEGNEGAERLYERAGFRPFFRSFHGRTD